MDKAEVVFATPEKQLLLSVVLAKDDTVQQVIDKSEVLNQYPEINLSTMPVGIFGKTCKLDQRVEAGERIEIYRPLLQNPMDARRNRAVNQK